MRAFVTLAATNLLFLFLIAAAIAFAFSPGLLPAIHLPAFVSVQSFKTMFLSILLEAFPFMLLGVAVSSCLQVLVPDRLLARLIPRNPLAGILFACALGVLFPVCECGLIPVVRRLIAKGMPLYIGVVFFLVGPIVNPVTYLATYTAFRTRPELLYARMGLAVAVGVCAGLVVYFFVRGNQLKGGGDGKPHSHAAGAAAGSGGHHDGHRHGGHRHDGRQHDGHRQDGHHDGHQHAGHHHDGHQHAGHRHDAPAAVGLGPRRPGGRRRNGREPGSGGRLVSVLEHAGSEFFDMGKYLLLGAILTAGMQAFVPRASLAGIGGSGLGAHLFMMGFAYVLSLCSASDAFVAASFGGTFSGGALLAFLVFGPMLDFKGTLMLLAAFRGRFVWLVAALAFVLVLAGSVLIGRLWLAS